ncbi:hypothetical protein GP486_002517 [Trichoglossum hirsutum]|uniref:Fungal-type protein kinase domain-containing protein n=1 Tax=Trichoglossum hirsutum TaxID=265104 RepID=A0A9P8RRL2_9PEZI|nr:hypothetical protein GP486_002517 [Trichoglossum hirsutum]
MNEEEDNLSWQSFLIDLCYGMAHATQSHRGRARRRPAGPTPNTQCSGLGAQTASTMNVLRVGRTHGPPTAHRRPNTGGPTLNNRSTGRTHRTHAYGGSIISGICIRDNLDLAIKENWEKSSGAPSKTGTRAFIAIGALYGEEHSFMHDLESFFWVLFWICIHYNGPHKESRVVPKFEKWNYEETEELAKLKTGTVANRGDFIKMIMEGTSLYLNSSGTLLNWEDGDRCLLDLNFAMKMLGKEPLEEPRKMGTRAFMAIGALYGEKYSFMHDLESFFWVLFWICIHYNGFNKNSRIVPTFEKWNCEDTEELAKLKKGMIDHEGDFIKTAEESFTSYYQPLVPWVNRLRKVVFSGNGRWKREDRELYSQIKVVLEKARSDPRVSAE